MKIKDNTLADLQSANVGDVVATSNGEHLLIVHRGRVYSLVNLESCQFEVIDGEHEFIDITIMLDKYDVMNEIRAIIPSNKLELEIK
ncbi:MAG: hypothetical protein KID02_16070 [Clostridiales bacterium]|jgi:hypothetical protein|nr:hypothetical protein [Clostridiales bacterium]DAV39079.1 MAG TPA: hypothetical protein [Caudoviricetes sp.]